MDSADGLNSQKYVSYAVSRSQTQKEGVLAGIHSSAALSHAASDIQRRSSDV